MWRAVRIVLLVFVAALQMPASAHALQWPLPGASGVLRAFGEMYSKPDGSASRHSGVDLAAEPGSRIYAVSEGFIAFVGNVPSADGGTHVAITVEAANGDKWSYVPVEASTVLRGSAVRPGDHLGFLAVAGDGSSSAPHLHIGLRRAGEYLDPMEFLAIPEIPDQPAPVVGDEAEGAIVAPVSAPVAAGIAQGSSASRASAQSGGYQQNAVASSRSGNAPAIVPVPVVAAVSHPAAALIRDADVIRPQIGAGQFEAGTTGTNAPVPALQAMRLAPALVAAAIFFVGYLKRPRLSCVTAQGDTVAAVVGQ